jgi:hypothetical protein
MRVLGDLPVGIDCRNGRYAKEKEEQNQARDVQLLHRDNEFNPV